jgi:hypothetical protein
MDLLTENFFSSLLKRVREELEGEWMMAHPPTDDLPELAIECACWQSGLATFIGKGVLPDGREWKGVAQIGALVSLLEE